MEQNEGFVTSFLNQSIDSQVGKILEAGVDREFELIIREGLVEFIGHETRHIPAVIPDQTVEREGNFGVLPSPARAIVAREALSGQAISPLKVHDENVQSGKPERQVEATNFHLIVEINPRTVADKEEIATTIRTILVMAGFSRKDLLLQSDDPKRPSVRIEQARSTLHLMSRGVLGNYDLVELPLNSPDDARKAIEQFRLALKDVISPPSKSPSDDFTAHVILNGRILSGVAADRGPKKISLPIVVMPKEYTVNIPYGATYLSRTGCSNFDQSDTMMIIEKNGACRVGAYSSEQGYYPDFKEI